MDADEALRTTWSSIFKRRGGPGDATKLWDRWDSEARAAALDKVMLEAGELPVVLARSPNGDATLLTTRRLVLRDGVTALTEVVDIKPVDFGVKRKDQLNELNVELTSGRSLTLTVESGHSYFALWNVLLNIVKRNTRNQVTP